MNEPSDAENLKAIDAAVEKLNGLLVYERARFVWVEDEDEPNPASKEDAQSTQPRSMRLTATRDGLIWIAIELLETVSHPTEATDGLMHPNYLNTPNPVEESNPRLLQLESIQRTDNWPPEPSSTVNMTWKDRVWMIGCGVIALNICFLIGSGIWFWITLLRGE